MRAQLGDTLHTHASHTDTPDQWGRIIEIRGPDGAPPYVIELPDGHIRLVFPGPDAVVEPRRPAAADPPATAPHGRRVHHRVGW